MSLLFLNLALAGDADESHPHTGIIPAFKGEPAAQKLTAKDLETLAANKPVKKQVKLESGGRGVAVMDIHAPTDVVWSKIKDYDSYPNWVDSLNTCEVYAESGNDLYVYFKASVLGIPAEWWIKHDYQEDKGYVTWTLDYSKHSDLDDSVGYWRVTEITADPPLTRVEYSVNIQLSGWIPSALEDMLADKGLTVATSWVKAQAEAEHGK